MAQVLDYPWNGIVLDGGYPNTGTPDASYNVFAFAETHNIQRVRVFLNPRTVMPVGTTTIPSGVQTQLLAIADSARTTVPGQPPLTCEIEWAMLGCTEPTSATASRRPWVTWLETFWEKVDDLLGDHDATWGYAVLTAPTVQELSAANGDTDPSMADWEAVSWSPAESPEANTGPWLEAITTEVVEHLRAAGATKPIIVPVVHYPVGTTLVSTAHPSGPWIDDIDTWYEAVVTPMGTDGFQLMGTYDTYNTAAAALSETYRSTWYESAYFDQTAGASSVIDSLELVPPDWITIPPEVLDSVSLPVEDLEATSLDEGASLTWTEPADFGDGDFSYYEIVFDELHWRTTDTAIEVGPVDNDAIYDVYVYVVTTVGTSEPATTTVTPSGTSPDPQQPYPPPHSDVPPTKPPITAPEPLTNAFPQARNFRPENWLKLPSEVEEGY